MSDKQPTDHAVRKRVAEDLETSFLVEAAAGTGKTTVLIERIMTIVTRGVARLHEVAAITFTEKAAGELKVRLRDELQKAVRETSSEQRERFRQALDDLDRMAVGTIHGFCAELIRERPVEAGVDPGFRVADQIEADLLFDRAFTDWLAGEMDTETKPLRRALEAGINHENIWDLARKFNEKRDTLERGAIASVDGAAQGLLSAIQATLDALTAFRDAHCEKRDDKMAKKIDAIEDQLQPASGSTPAELINRMRATDFDLRGGSPRAWVSKDSFEEFKARLKNLRERLDAIPNALVHEALRGVVEWLRGMLDAYKEVKREREVLDFLDLLVRARVMLRDSRPARDYFKGRFRFILVDEFQDTDPLQAEIVFHLSERAGDHGATWDAVRLEPGKLFIVGDPKQSIYGFRRADLDLYERVKAIFQEQGDVVPIEVNFRSVPGLLDEVNAVFEPQMMSSANFFSPAYVRLRPYREVEGHSVPAVTLLLPSERLASQKQNADERRRNEAGAIAEFVWRLVTDGRPVYDNDAKTWRLACYGDVAMLYRSTTGLEALEDALRARDIPYQVAGGRHYFRRLEILELLGLLHALARPFDEANVIAALRSPFFGFSDEDLVRHRLDGGSFDYTRAEAAGALREAFAQLCCWHDRAKRGSVAPLLEAIFDETKALAIYGLKPHGAQRVANLLKVEEMARAVEATEAVTFEGFVRWLAQRETTDSVEEESPVAEPTDDVVQLATFHKAKGLEFPVVVLYDLAAKDKKDTGAQCVVDRASGRLDVKVSKEVCTIGWPAAAEIEKEREKAEELRLLYVAMTRARDLLVLPMNWGAGGSEEEEESERRGKTPKESPYVQWLAERYRDESGHLLSRSEAVAVRSTDGYRLDLRADEAFALPLEPVAELPPAAREAAARHATWSAELAKRRAALEGGLLSVTATEIMEAIGEKRPSPPRGGDVMAFGQLVHRVLELIDFDRPADTARLAKAIAPSLGLTEQRAGEAAALVEKVLTGDLFRQHIAKARAVHREVPFAAALTNGIVIEGKMDLVLVEEGGLTIVDFKTDDVDESGVPAKFEHYRPQAIIYARGLGDATGLPVRDVLFCFVRPGVVAPVPVTGPILADAEALVHSAFVSLW